MYDIVRARRMIVENSINMRINGEFKAGEATTVTAVFQNGFNTVQNVELQLNVPKDWEVTTTSEKILKV